MFVYTKSIMVIFGSQQDVNIKKIENKTKVSY